jgi:hypothetical protein
MDGSSHHSPSFGPCPARHVCRSRQSAVVERSRDLIGLRVCDVNQGSRIVPRAMVLQRKTQLPVRFELTEQSRDAIGAWVTRAKLLRQTSILLQGA